MLRSLPHIQIFIRNCVHKCIYWIKLNKLSHLSEIINVGFQWCHTVQQNLAASHKQWGRMFKRISDQSSACWRRSHEWGVITSKGFNIMRVGPLPLLICWSYILQCHSCELTVHKPTAAWMFSCVMDLDMKHEVTLMQRYSTPAQAVLEFVSRQISLRKRWLCFHY